MWTDAQKLDYLMTLPWSVRVDRNNDDPPGYLVARVGEAPDALATGATERELGRDLWESLRTSLACRLEFGDDLPRPGMAAFPWEVGVAPSQPTNRPKLIAIANNSVQTELLDSAAA